MRIMNFVIFMVNYRSGADEKLLLNYNSSYSFNTVLIIGKLF